MEVLICDDDALTRVHLRTLLESAGYAVSEATDGEAAWKMLCDSPRRLVITDWTMPRLDGPGLCRRIRSNDMGRYVYCVMLTGNDGRENLVEALDAGADDFLSKPADPAVLAARLRVASRILSIDSRDVTIFALAKLAESRDNDTGEHLERVRAYCAILGGRMLEMGVYPDLLTPRFVELLCQTSPLHDVGKVAVPDAILLKPGKLTEDEFSIMKRHTCIGARTLGEASRRFPDADFLRMATDIAASHHERWDGSGYSRGLAGEDIPLAARIVSVADVYDALTTRRVYKPAMDVHKAARLIREGAGTQFDPSIVRVFEACENEFHDVAERLRDAEPEGSEEDVFADLALRPAA